MLAVVTVGSALSRPLRGRLEVLLEVLPFPLLHASATTAVFAGVALALAARGLRFGHRLAWVATVALLATTAVLNIVKGLDVEEALISVALAVWLVARRDAFGVLPTQAQARRALVGAVTVTAVALLAATVLTLTMGRHHHPRTGETVRAVAERLGGDTALPLSLTPAAGPALTAVGLGVVVVGLWLLLSPRRAPSSTRADREHARVIVARYGGGTLDYFALRDDKDWFFTGDAVVAYAVRGGACLVSPDPIGPARERYQTWADFMDFATSHGWAVAVVAAAADWCPVYEHAGLHCNYLGDEAVVDVASFTLVGAAMKSLRHAVGRVERAGVVAEFIDPSGAPAPVRAGVLAIAELSRRGHDERGFSMTLSRLFDPADTGLLLVRAVDATGRVLAFIQWVPAADLPGWSLDVMRRDTGADVPNGVTDFLIVKTLEHAAAQGAQGLGLNFAPKQLRPIAAGTLSVPAARITAVGAVMVVGMLL